MPQTFSTLLLQIASVVIPLFSIIACGFLFARWQKNPDIRFITDYLTYVASPALVFHSLLDRQLDYTIFYPIMASSIAVAILGMVVGMTIGKRIAHGSSAAAVTIAFVNSGNMGLPTCFFAFGEEGLATATLFFVGMSIMHYTFGSIMAGGKGRLREALLLPLTPAAVLAILLNRAQVTIPLVVERPIELLADSTIPLMLFTLGMRLSSIQFSKKRISSALGVIRFLVGLAGGLACVYLFNLQGVQARVVMLQSTMPPAVFNFILCEKFDQDPELAAATILFGTVLSFFTIPLFLYILFSL